MGNPPRLAPGSDGDWRLPDGSVYQGEFKDGLFHGRGILRWENGAVYEGEFRNGLAHGHGRLTGAEGSVLEGEFRNGLAHGLGRYTGPTGDAYVGEFRQDLFWGRGTYTDRDGTIFKGEFRRGMAHGTGQIHFSHGAIYEGQIRYWRMQGQGTYTDKDGIVYRGWFEDGFPVRGEILRGRDRYEGEIENWRPHGQGMLQYGQGDRYTGEFWYGQFHGRGTYVYANGDRYEGEFRFNERHGHGVFIRHGAKGHKRKQEGWWQLGVYIGTEPPGTTLSRKTRAPRLDAESVFYRQPDLLAEHLRALLPSRPEIIDLYVINFAAYGGQDVFLKEARYSESLFQRRFGATGRLLSLINHPSVTKDVPLASVTNLRRALHHVAEIMDPDEDIVVLYLTSHGSRKKGLDVYLRGVPLNDLSPVMLKKMLDEAGIRWRVVFVSACFSGAFIEPLHDDHSLIMTASTADHVSFGCGDESEFTFFGRALLQYALNRTTDFGAAYDTVRQLVLQWEARDGYSHSQPQMWLGPALDQHLAKWRQQVTTLAGTGDRQP